MQVYLLTKKNWTNSNNFKDQGGKYMIEVKKENYEKINETITITNQNKVNQRNYILGLIEAKLKVTTNLKEEI